MDILLPVVLAILSSSTIVAIVQWLKDRKKTLAESESLVVHSMSEVVVALRAELAAVREDLEKARAEVDGLTNANRALLTKLNMYIDSGRPVLRGNIRRERGPARGESPP